MQFSLKKRDSSGFFYVLTVVTYTQRSFRAEEPGASEVVSSFVTTHFTLLEYVSCLHTQLLFLKKVFYVTKGFA